MARWRQFIADVSVANAVGLTSVWPDRSGRGAQVGDPVAMHKVSAMDVPVILGIPISETTVIALPSLGPQKTGGHTVGRAQMVLNASAASWTRRCWFGLARLGWLVQPSMSSRRVSAWPACCAVSPTIRTIIAPSVVSGS